MAAPSIAQIVASGSSAEIPQSPRAGYIALRASTFPASESPPSGSLLSRLHHRIHDAALAAGVSSTTNLDGSAYSAANIKNTLSTTSVYESDDNISTARDSYEQAEDDLHALCQMLLGLNPTIVSILVEESTFLQCAFDVARTWYHFNVAYSARLQIAEQHYNLASQELDQDESDHSIHTVLGLLMMFDHCIETGKDSIAYGNLKLAEKIAIEIGLHRDANDVSRDMAEFRCRLWWLCFVCQTAYCLESMQPSRIMRSPQISQQRLPALDQQPESWGEFVPAIPSPFTVDASPIAQLYHDTESVINDNWDIEAGSASELNYRRQLQAAHSTSQTSDLVNLQRGIMSSDQWYTPGIHNQTALGYYILLCRIFGRITDFLILGLGSTNRNMSLADVPKPRLVSSLRDWWNSVPETIRFPLQNLRLNSALETRQAIWNVLLYHYAVQRVHRLSIINLLKSNTNMEDILGNDSYKRSVISAVEASTHIEYLCTNDPDTLETLPVILHRKFLLYNGSVFAIMLQIMRPVVDIEETERYVGIHLKAMDVLYARTSKARETKIRLTQLVDRTSGGWNGPELAQILPI
eukprot:jgi/Hompol1/5682/HPOL_002023-RA